MAWGVELGKFGTFTLRIVQPVFDDDILIGYIEIGKEIEDVLEDISKEYNVGLATIIKKEFLNRDDWEEGMRMLNREYNWEYSPESVTIYKTVQSFSSKEDYISDEQNHGHGDRAIHASFDNKIWHIMSSALEDVSGKEVGELIILNDVTAINLAFKRFIVFSISIATIILFGLVSFLYVLLGRVDKSIAFQQSKLVRIKRALDASSDAVGMTTANGEHFYQNDTFTKLFGYTLEEIKKIKPIALFANKEIAKKVFSTTDTGKSFNSEIWMITKKNKRILIHFRTSVVRSDNGKIIAIVGILTDITERRKIENKVKKQSTKIAQQKDKLETIIQGIGDSVFVVDKDLNIILSNKAASDISGFSEKEAMGKKYTDVLKFVFESNTKKINDSFVNKAIKTGKVQTMENHTLLITKKGKQIPVADSAAALKDKDGKVIGCVVVFRDVSEERMIDRIKTEFVSIASHQLKTPLTSIKWMSELLLKVKMNKKQSECVSDIHHISIKLLELVGELLDVSHIETGRKFEITKKKTDISKIIESILEENKKLSDDKKISIITCKCLSKKLSMNIDGDKINQVFANLINNAIKYTNKNGKIEIDCKKKGNKITFEIKDNGIGIPSNQKKRMFEKFFRADNATKHEIEGTGLGLYIAKSILEAHDGEINFDSKEDEGTTFYVTLPVN